MYVTSSCCGPQVRAMCNVDLLCVLTGSARTESGFDTCAIVGNKGPPGTAQFRGRPMKHE
eukprot:8792671-Alexandrium_andersonii.AAC.1